MPRPSFIDILFFSHNFKLIKCLNSRREEREPTAVGGLGKSSFQFSRSFSKVGQQKAVAIVYFAADFRSQALPSKIPIFHLHNLGKQLHSDKHQINIAFFEAIRLISLLCVTFPCLSTNQKIQCVDEQECQHGSRSCLGAGSVTHMANTFSKNGWAYLACLLQSMGTHHVWREAAKLWQPERSRSA